MSFESYSKHSPLAFQEAPTLWHLLSVFGSSFLHKAPRLHRSGQPSNPILTRSYIGNNLRDLSRCSLDGLRTFYFCIPNLKAISGACLQNRSNSSWSSVYKGYSPNHGSEYPLLVGIGYVFGQHFETNRLTNNPCRQVPLRIKTSLSLLAFSLTTAWSLLRSLPIVKLISVAFERSKSR